MRDSHSLFHSQQTPDFIAVGSTKEVGLWAQVEHLPDTISGPLVSYQKCKDKSKLSTAECDPDTNTKKQILVLPGSSQIVLQFFLGADSSLSPSDIGDLGKVGYMGSSLQRRMLLPFCTIPPWSPVEVEGL